MRRCGRRATRTPSFSDRQADAEDAAVLVLGLSNGQTALPVFGLEEEAGMFL
ncbi:MAG TPA: hypothetical protein VJ827_07165 [Rubrobacter sp.]|nr:hypothetical protein [Rubrobacter sp.]